MKFAAIIIALFLAACNPNPVQNVCPDRVQDSTQIEELLSINTRLNDTIASLRSSKDSVQSKLFLASYKVEKVRFYLALCQRDETQNKFLKGWVTRAVE